MATNILETFKLKTFSNKQINQQLPISFFEKDKYAL
jgi:hypothetical protein